MRCTGCKHGNKSKNIHLTYKRKYILGKFIFYFVTLILFKVRLHERDYQRLKFYY